jgi:hypothetical protein
MPQTALGLAAIAVVQVLLLALVQGWIVARKERRDYARQDQVADRVATVAREAAAANKRVEQQLKGLDEQGQKIHTLVNSDMTAARTNERNQAMLTLLALKRVQALSEKLGMKVSDEEVKAIEDAEMRIEELNAILADRRAAQAAVEELEKKKKES